MYIKQLETGTGGDTFEQRQAVLLLINVPKSYITAVAAAWKGFC